MGPTAVDSFAAWMSSNWPWMILVAVTLAAVCFWIVRRTEDHDTRHSVKGDR